MESVFMGFIIFAVILLVTQTVVMLYSFHRMKRYLIDTVFHLLALYGRELHKGASRGAEDEKAG